jgi:hypothetical protein
MAALTVYEASKLYRNPLAAGLLTEIATSDQLIAKLKMVPKQGSAFSYVRENALASAEFVSPGHTSLTESSTTFDQVTCPIRMLVSDIDIYNFATETSGGGVDQMATQISKKAKAAGRTIADKAINGAYATSVTILGAGASGPAIDAITVSPLSDTDRQGKGTIKYVHTGTFWSYRGPGDLTFGAPVAIAADGSATLTSANPSKWATITVDVSDIAADTAFDVTIVSTSNEPDGLKKLVTSAQTITSVGASGDALAFATMDSLIDLVKVPGDLAFVANAAILRKFFVLSRALGGNGAEMLNVPGVTGPVPSYRGIPILKCDNIGSNETKSVSTLSSMYLVNFNAEEGFYAGVASSGSMNFDASPMSTSVMGLRFEDVGNLEDKDARRMRIKWYGAFGLGSTLAAARASELVTA